MHCIYALLLYQRVGIVESTSWGYFIWTASIWTEKWKIIYLL